MINFKYIVYIICIISFISCISQDESYRYNTLFMLPLSLLIMSILFHRIYDLLKNSVVFNIFIAQAIIRYCIIPYKMSFENISFTRINSSLSGNTAVFIMILEVMFIFFVLHLFAQKQRKAFLNKTQEIKAINGNFFLYAFLFLSALYIYSSGFLSVVNPIWDLGSFVQKYAVEGEERGDTGYGGILFTPFKIIIALFFISLIFKNKYIKHYKKKYIYIIIIALSSLFIIGTSRLSIIFFVTPLLVLITMIVDKKSSKKLIIASITMIIPIFFAVSIAKFTRDTQEVTSENILNASSLNAYFAGPGNIAIGIDAYEDLNIKDKPLFFINDLLQNFPGLSKYSSNSYKTNIYFNEQIYGHRLYQDQIVPLSISGIFNFGYWGSFIYAPFFITLALYMERKSYREIFLGYKFVYITISFSLSMVFMLNISTLYFNIVSSFLFIYIPFFVINNLKKITIS